MGSANNRCLISAHFCISAYFLTVETYKRMRLTIRAYGILYLLLFFYDMSGKCAKEKVFSLYLQVSKKGNIEILSAGVQLCTLSNAGILVLLEPSSETSLGLSDVDLSTRAWYLVHDVRLLLDGERVFDLSEHGPESRARPKHHFDVVVPARLSDPLTNICYIRQHH